MIYESKVNALGSFLRNSLEITCFPAALLV